MEVRLSDKVRPPLISAHLSRKLQQSRSALTKLLSELPMLFASGFVSI